jgi:2'-5' RNA ligase
MTIRSFFAIPLKPAVMRRLADHADTLSVLDHQGLVNWTDADNYHLTLCFLGEISLDQVVALEQVVLEKLRGWEPFQLSLNRAEYIEVNPELALLAALTEPKAELLALQRWVVELVRAAGIAVSERDYTPHITLGRLSPDAPFEAPPRWPGLELPLCADAVVLYQSKPGAHGSLYTPLFDIRLERSVETPRRVASLK